MDPLDSHIAKETAIRDRQLRAERHIGRIGQALEREFSSCPLDDLELAEAVSAWLCDHLGECSPDDFPAPSHPSYEVVQRQLTRAIGAMAMLCVEANA